MGRPRTLEIAEVTQVKPRFAGCKARLNYRGELFSKPPGATNGCTRETGFMQVFKVKGPSEFAFQTGLVTLALQMLCRPEHIQVSLTGGPLHRLLPFPGTPPSPLVILLTSHSVISDSLQPYGL